MNSPNTQLGRPREIGLVVRVKEAAHRMATRIEENLGFTLVATGIAGLGAAIFAFVFYVWRFGPSIASQHARWAEFGDFYGGVVGTILSFLAVIAVLLTLWVQNKELKAQLRSHQELKDEAKRQADLAQKQLEVQRLIALIQGRSAFIDGVTANVGDMAKTKSNFIRQLGEDVAKLDALINPKRR